MSLVLREYRTISRISGPLLFVEAVNDVGYNSSSESSLRTVRSVEDRF